MIRHVYSIVAALAGPVIVLGAVIKGRFGGHWRDRLGLRFAPHRSVNRSRLWFHGASVGEIRSASAVINDILRRQPEIEILLSAGTPAGLAIGHELFTGDSRVTILAAPLDFWGSPRRALARLKPDALIIMETELWPNLIFEARAAGARLALASARISARSFKRYRLIRGFMSRLLSCFDIVAAVGAPERGYFAALGAPAGRLTVMGNPKFDDLLSSTRSDDFQVKRDNWHLRLWGDLDPSPVITAGSTHPGEDEIILEAFKKLLPRHPDLKLILAPRHLTRLPEVMWLLERNDLAAVRASEASQPLFGHAKVVVPDVIGHLTAFYALSRAAVVGGSLLPGLMGHNPLEPASVGTPILFGPRMDSFSQEAASLLKVGGAIATTADRLAADLEPWLDNPTAAARAGAAARQYLIDRPLAAPALALAILELLRKNEEETCSNQDIFG